LTLILALSAGSALAAGGINGMFEGFPIVLVKVNGRLAQGDVPAVNFFGRTLVPVRLVTEQLGATVEWDPDTWTASVSLPGTAELQAEIATLRARIAELETQTAQEPEQSQQEPGPTIPTLGSIEGIEAYLNSNHTTVSTPAGPLSLTYRIWTNDNHGLSHDLRVIMDYDKTPLFFTDLVTKISITSEVREATRDVLREHGRFVYDLVWQTFNGKKIRGCYYRSWYKYPTIQAGFESRQHLSWQNYHWEILGPGTIYENSKVTEFHFTPDKDDY
jgi:hypothetical protein